MKTHSNLASRFFGILAMVAVGWLQPTAVFGQTAEGTVITNTATVSYTDANTNAYSTVDGVATVTVGFGAGVDVVAAAAAATPVSPSAPNTMDFNVQNIGNGTDNVVVGATISDNTVITAVTNYRFNAADYANIGLLNTALAGFPMVAGATITITVEYTVGLNKGGEPSTYTLTATSIRDGGVNDNDITVVTPALTGTVAVTPNGAQNLNQLPSSGAVPNYTFTFTVTNDQTGGDVFDLVATSPGSSVITILFVNGDAGTSSTVTVAGEGGSQPIDVIYTVADLLAPDTLYLTATSQADVGTNNQGFADIQVIKANMAITKVAYRDDQVTLIGAGLVLPGEFIQYKVTVTNNGTAPASTVHVDDFLPAELTFNVATEDAPTWTFSNTGNDLDADLTGTLAAGGGTRFFWIRALVK